MVAVSDVLSGVNVGQGGVDGPVKFGDFSSNGSRDTAAKSKDSAFAHVFLNFDNCQPAVVSDVISGKADEDVGLDVCGNFGDSRLKSSDASFSAVFRTSITSERKNIVTSYPVCL